MKITGLHQVTEFPKPVSPDFAAMAREPVTLAECPIGLFVSDSGNLCLKTEYGNNEGRIDAYIVSSGEFFWGRKPQTIVNQRLQLVRPIDVEAVATLSHAAGRAEGLETAARVCDDSFRDGSLTRTYECETADELAARIRALASDPVAGDQP